MFKFFKRFWQILEDVLSSIAGITSSIDNAVNSINNVTKVASDMSETFVLETNIDTTKARADLKAAYELLGLEYIEPTSSSSIPVPVPTIP